MSSEPAHRLERAPGMEVWWDHQRLALLSAVRHLRVEWWSTSLIVLTLGIALALPGLLLLASERTAALGAQWSQVPRINAFLPAQLPEAQRLRLLEGWRSGGEFSEVAWQTPQQTLAEFLESGAVLDAAEDTLLADAALPGVAILTPIPRERAPGRMRALADRVAAQPGVEGVQVDLDWVIRFRAAAAALETLASAVVVALALGVLLVVGALTRMALEQRRDEIRVLRLVGGTRRFVRRPFLWLGVLQGLGGGLVAWALLIVLMASIGGALEQLARSYGLTLTGTGVPPGFGLQLALSGVVLGGSGAWLASGLTLRSIDRIQ